MKIIRYFIIILTLLSVSVIIYLNYNKHSLEILPETHELVVNNSIKISDRVLAVKVKGEIVYIIGYEGFSIYNIKEDRLKRYSPHYLDESLLDRGVRYKAPKNIINIFFYGSFSEEERLIFSKLIFKENRLKNVEPYFYSKKENSIVDLDKMVIIAYPQKYLVEYPCIYIYNGDSFMKINVVKHDIFSYYNSKLGKGISHNSIGKLKEVYKDKMILYNSIHDFSEEDIGIFLKLREEDLIEKNKWSDMTKEIKLNINILE